LHQKGVGGKNFEVTQRSLQATKPSSGKLRGRFLDS